MINAPASSRRFTVLDYKRVREYWNNVPTSILGPYKMDGFGFPTDAGKFRFQEECKIVDKLIDGFSPQSAVLDLGSGAGYWTEYFASRFSKVVSVEASNSLYKGLEARFIRNSKVHTHHYDVLKFTPIDKFKIVFLGGLLMYLNQPEVEILLKKISTYLEPGGVILCRESTTRSDTVTLSGNYQVVYRSVKTYEKLFSDNGYDVEQTIPNNSYIMLQMPAEWVKKWKRVVPNSQWALSLIGRSSYWFFRSGYPFSGTTLAAIATSCGFQFPKLKNHFFVLKIR